MGRPLIPCVMMEHFSSEIRRDNKKTEKSVSPLSRLESFQHTDKAELGRHCDAGVCAINFAFFYFSAPTLDSACVFLFFPPRMKDEKYERKSSFRLYLIFIVEPASPNSSTSSGTFRPFHPSRKTILDCFKSFLCELYALKSWKREKRVLMLTGS